MWPPSQSARSSSPARPTSSLPCLSRARVAANWTFPLKGNVQFAATLALATHGNELVGLAGEELLADWLGGHISGAKRTMGSTTTYRISGRRDRSEDVAANWA